MRPMLPHGPGLAFLNRGCHRDIPERTRGASQRSRGGSRDCQRPGLPHTRRPKPVVVSGMPGPACAGGRAGALRAHVGGTQARHPAPRAVDATAVPPMMLTGGRRCNLARETYLKQGDTP